MQMTDPLNPKALILLVDDNRPLREVMAIMLKDEGYEVVEAQDGRGAL
jgi:CheY-like chemotaxis protein